jgi:hypothetical protein
MTALLTLFSARRLRCARIAFVLFAAGASAAALADPPGRVARLAYAAGPVSFAPAGQDDWLQATLNRPLISGDRLWTDAGGRDEVQVGSANVRMDGGTLLSVVNVDDRSVQLQLNQGRLDVRVRDLPPDGVFEIDTPNLALNFRRPGDYRVDVDPNGNVTSVAVRAGQAEASGDGASYLIDPGQAYRFGGTDLRNNEPLAMAPADDFDRWSSERDRRQEQSVSARYVPRELTGYDDLDDNGSWSSVEGYGNVWMPTRVDADWAPYRDGHWAWVEPWGWTWIDDAPWGFAVSHYGRWAHFGSRWGWVPGPVAVRPVYAPALVVFIGGFSGPRENVAWFPLGPREAYRPGYHVSQRYFDDVNLSNTTINRIQVNNFYNNRGNVSYVNRQINGAVVAVPLAAFAGARPVNRSAVRLAPHAFDRAPVLQGAGVTPQRVSVSGAAAPGRRPGAAIQNRAVIARTAPPSQARAFAAGAPGAAWQAPQGGGQHRPFQQIRTVQAGGPARPIASAPHGMAAGFGHGPQQGQAGQPGQGGPGRAQNQPQIQQPGQRPGAQQALQQGGRTEQSMRQEGQRPGAPQGMQPGGRPEQQAGRPGMPQGVQPGQQPGRPGMPQAVQPGQPGHPGAPQGAAQNVQATQPHSGMPPQGEAQRGDRPGQHPQPAAAQQPARQAPQAMPQQGPQAQHGPQREQMAERRAQQGMQQREEAQNRAQPHGGQAPENRPQPSQQHNAPPQQHNEQHNEQQQRPPQQPHNMPAAHGEPHPGGGQPQGGHPGGHEGGHEGGH